MSPDESDPAAARIHAAFADAITGGELNGEDAGMPIQWVFVGTYLDDAGTVCNALLAHEGGLVHEALGLLTLGDALWRAKAVREQGA